MSDGQIDWSAIHRRIEAINTSITKGFSPSPEDRKRILRARADFLARQPGREQAGDTLEVVEFILANERYGIESGYVREVYPLKDYTPLPCTPPFVIGLLNVRGRIISVIDIKKFFDMPGKGISDLNKVIIIHDYNMEFGILADSILGVQEIAVRDIQPPLPTLTGIREEYLRGVTGERTVILDARKLLADKKIIVHEEA
ncbi:MAG: chemotaxis protein CheW [Syntrophobacteraceae bacterium]|jgi:purine-binding chemotaxis protein CheW